MTNLEAINHLFITGVINQSTRTQLTNRADKLEAKALKEARQSEVNAHVETHLLSVTPGDLFKHRTVWEAVGRGVFTRDEVLKALQHHKSEGLVDQVRKGPNNFQIFWARLGAEGKEEEVEAQ